MHILLYLKIPCDFEDSRVLNGLSSFRFGQYTIPASKVASPTGFPSNLVASDFFPSSIPWGPGCGGG